MRGSIKLYGSFLKLQSPQITTNKPIKHTIDSTQINMPPIAIDEPFTEETKTDQNKAVENKTPLQAISQGATLPGIPSFTTFEKQRHWTLEHMAGAFRVFARKGYTEGMSVCVQPLFPSINLPSCSPATAPFSTH